jgi:hypothetical protein
MANRTNHSNAFFERAFRACLLSFAFSESDGQPTFLTARKA